MEIRKEKWRNEEEREREENKGREGGRERSEYQTKQPHGYLVAARHTGMTCCAPSGSPPNGGLTESHQKEVLTCTATHSVVTDKLYRLHSETSHGGKREQNREGSR